MANLSGQLSVTGIIPGDPNKSIYDVDPSIGGAMLDSQALRDSSTLVKWVNTVAPYTLGSNVHHCNLIAQRLGYMGTGGL